MLHIFSSNNVNIFQHFVVFTYILFIQQTNALMALHNLRKGWKCYTTIVSQIALPLWVQREEQLKTEQRSPVRVEHQLLP